MSWKIEREIVSSIPVDSKFPDGDMTELSKITATHVETGNLYSLKARMGTAVDRKMAWDNIFAQHEKRTKPPVEDPVVVEGVNYLTAKEAK